MPDDDLVTIGRLLRQYKGRYRISGKPGGWGYQARRVVNGRPAPGTPVEGKDVTDLAFELERDSEAWAAEAAAEP